MAQSIQCQSQCNGSQNYADCTTRCTNQEMTNYPGTQIEGGNGFLGGMMAVQQQAQIDQANRQQAELKALEIERLRLQNEALRRQLEKQ